MPKVLVAVPGEEVKIQTIPEGTEAINELVGGPAECVQLGNDFILYCNHEGTDRDLPVNPHFSQGIIKGPFVITKTQQEGGNIGIDRDDISLIMDTFIR